MKYFLFIIAICVQISAQNLFDSSKAILDAGKQLYRLEKASWNATDFLRDNFPEKKTAVGGYVSYELNDEMVTVFFNKRDPSQIVARFAFDYIPGPKPKVIDILDTKPTSKETELFALREDARHRVESNTEHYFKYYDSCSFNFIPIITPASRLVYILTAPNGCKDVIIGNDYLLTYDKSNELVKKEKFHNTMLKFPYGNPADSAGVSYHSHILSNFITPTDVCTLLLYKDYLHAKTHFVMGENYVSIFDVQKEILMIVRRDSFEKIYKGSSSK